MRYCAYDIAWHSRSAIQIITSYHNGIILIAMLCNSFHVAFCPPLKPLNHCPGSLAHIEPHYLFLTWINAFKNEENISVGCNNTETNCHFCGGLSMLTSFWIPYTKLRSPVPNYVLIQQKERNVVTFGSGRHGPKASSRRVSSLTAFS